MKLWSRGKPRNTKATVNRLTEKKGPPNKALLPKSKSPSRSVMSYAMGKKGR